MQPGLAWKWRQASREIEIEFLTPSFGAHEGLCRLEVRGVSAQGLQYLASLIAEPIHVPVLDRSGILIQVRRPERFAIHKPIVADRRQGSEQIQASQDRMQAAFLIDVRDSDRLMDLEDAFETALGKGRQ